MNSVIVEFEKFIGKGSCGSVSLYKYTRPLDGKTLYAAVKTSNQKHSGALYTEFEILSRMKRCRRIIQCYGTNVQKELKEDGSMEYKLPMEYASGGSLRDLIEEGKLDDSMIRNFTRMILQGLVTIHRYGYVHCDLKPDNILVFPKHAYKDGERKTSYELKISDFGMSKKDGDSSWWSLDRPYVGTPIYMSPESYTDGKTYKELDLWSLGCVVVEMYTGKRPWWHKNFNVTYLDLYYKPEIPPDLPCDVKLFLKTCFAPIPTERKDALTLLKQFFWRRNLNKFSQSSS